MFFNLFKRETRKIEVPIPSINAPIEKWQNFVDSNEWPIVYKAWNDFSPRGYEPYTVHDKEVGNLLWTRLFRIEQPILGRGFLKRHSRQIIFVDCDVDSETIKENVRQAYIGVPQYVVEKNGKLRGFCLSSELIVAGITLVLLPVSEMQREVRKRNLFLTNQDDAIRITLCRNKLSQMMKKAGVPSFSGVYYWIIKTSLGGDEEFQIWRPDAEQSSFAGNSDFSPMLAKL